jgi:hypothetical protein
MVYVQYITYSTYNVDALFYFVPTVVCFVLLPLRAIPQVVFIGLLLHEYRVFFDPMYAIHIDYSISSTPLERYM